MGNSEPLEKGMNVMKTDRSCITDFMCFNKYLEDDAKGRA